MILIGFSLSIRCMCSTRRTSRDAWSRLKLSAWMFVKWAWTEFAPYVWSVARKHLCIYIKYSWFRKKNISHSPLYVPSAVLWALSRWTSVVRCTSWRRVSILVGILGVTARRTTTCFPSDPSEWCVDALTTVGSLFECFHNAFIAFSPAGPWEAQDLPVWGGRVQGPQDGDHGWWCS